MSEEGGVTVGSAAEEWAKRAEKQIPRRNDRKKSKGKARDGRFVG